MGAQVFANGKEVSCKKSDDMSVAAMPDVCWTPPPPPVGPIPIPYPNFSQSSDTTDGTRTVKIAGDEVGMKNQSNYKTSNGDEAATKGVGMGLVTATIQGTTLFAAWSFDVKFEDANAIRFMDMTTHNHMSGEPANPPSMTVSTGTGSVSLTGDAECVDLENKLKDAESNDTKTGQVDDGQVLATAKHSEQGFFKAGSESLMKKNIKPSARSGYCPRPTRDKLPGGKTTEPKIACTQDSYNNYTCNSGHAEGKTIQKIFANNPTPGGTLTLRIRWNEGGQIRQDPCPACKSAICKTAQSCNITIQLCVQEGNEMKKKPAPCRNGRWKPSR